MGNSGGVGPAVNQTFQTVGQTIALSAPRLVAVPGDFDDIVVSPTPAVNNGGGTSTTVPRPGPTGDGGLEIEYED